VRAHLDELPAAKGLEEADLDRLPRDASQWVTGASDASAAARPVGTVDALKPEQRDEGAGKLAVQAPAELAHARFLPALLGPKLPAGPELCKLVGVRSAARSFVAEAPKLPALAAVVSELMVFAPQPLAEQLELSVAPLDGVASPEARQQKAIAVWRLVEQ
jgi:hypothetical protein